MVPLGILGSPALGELLLLFFWSLFSELSKGWALKTLNLPLWFNFRGNRIEAGRKNEVEGVEWEGKKNDDFNVIEDIYLKQTKIMGKSKKICAVTNPFSSKLSPLTITLEDWLGAVVYSSISKEEQEREYCLLRER